MKLRPVDMLALFLLGAVAALIGDHGHVVTGTTTYFTTSVLTSVPFVASSPIWFPVMVGGATIGLAEVRLHLPRPRGDVTFRQCLGGVAAVVGIYLVTALIHRAPTVPATALIVVLAVLTWCVLGDGPAVVCGILAAVLGPIVEIVLVEGACSPTPTRPTPCSGWARGFRRCTSHSAWWPRRSASMPRTGSDRLISTLQRCRDERLA